MREPRTRTESDLSKLLLSRVSNGPPSDTSKGFLLVRSKQIVKNENGIVPIEVKEGVNFLRVDAKSWTPKLSADQIIVEVDM